MVKILSQHDDFRDEKTIVESFLPLRNVFYNSIERVWAQAKCFTRARCKYSYAGLQKNSSIGTEQHRHSSHSKSLRLHECISKRAGRELKDAVKYKLHRRVPKNK